MYAIIESCGKQYKVAEGDVVFFEKTKEYDIDEPGTPLLININTFSKVIEKLSKLDLEKTFTKINRAKTPQR